MSEFTGNSPHSPAYGIPSHWGVTKFGYHFTESDERNGSNPVGKLLSISEYRGVEVNTRTDGQKASLDVSKYRAVHPNQLAANMMWLNHGGIGVSSLTGHISPDYKVFQISDSFEPRYVHHLFRSSRYVGYFSAIATGVRPNAQRVTKTVLDATPVPLPPLDEQACIADYLDRETGEIDLIVEKLDELAAKLEARRGIAISDEIAPHYHAGSIPLAFASDPAQFFDGDWVESKDQDPEGEIRLLQLADIGVGRFLDKSDRHVNQEAFDRLQCKELSVGDVLIARMPEPISRACILPEGLGRSITVVDVAVLRPDTSKILPEYLAYVLNSRRFRSLVESLQGGSTRQRIPRSRLGQQHVPFVSIETQRVSIVRLDEITGKIDAMLAKVASLKALLIERRVALITDVVTGRKEVA
ncbi:restriction endonuclease S subunit [Rhodococcus sp. OK519]|nr:restriction endonuclease S subunit [Rhodococcus sp. OK519]